MATDCGPVASEDFRARGGLELGEHAHPATHFCFPLEGRLVEREGRSERILRPGQVRASPPGDSHRLRIGPDGVRCLLLFVDDPVIAGSGLPPPDGRRWLAGRRVSRIADRLAAETARTDDVSPVAMETLSLELLAVLRRDDGVRPGPPPPWLARTRERLRDATDAPPTLAELAQEAGVSRAHLARAFRNHFGCTVGEHLRALRLETARRMILTTDLPLGRIAFRAGYADQSHMTRAVAAGCGLPPGRLRAAARRAP